MQIFRGQQDYVLHPLSEVGNVLGLYKKRELLGARESGEELQLL